MPKTVNLILSFEYILVIFFFLNREKKKCPRRTARPFISVADPEIFLHPDLDPEQEKDRIRILKEKNFVEDHQKIMFIFSKKLSC